jgi:hypothetical protein
MSWRPSHTPGVAGNGDDVLEEHIVCREVEVIVIVTRPFLPVIEGLSGCHQPEVRAVAGVPGHLRSPLVQAAAWHYANASKLGDAPGDSGTANPLSKNEMRV